MGIFLLAIPQIALAYDYESYEFTDDGDFLLTNYADEHSAESKIILYMYADTSDIEIKTTRNHYQAYCVRGKIPEGMYMASVMYNFRPENAQEVQTLNGGEIWIWQFNIENGTYRFSSPNGSGSYGNLPNIYTLKSDLFLPEYGSDYDPLNPEKTGEEEKHSRIRLIQTWNMQKRFPKGKT